MSYLDLQVATIHCQRMVDGAPTSRAIARRYAEAMLSIRRASVENQHILDVAQKCGMPAKVLKDINADRLWIMECQDTLNDEMTYAMIKKAEL